MAFLTPDQIDDFVTLTLSKFHKLKWTDLSLEHPTYIASQLISDKKIMIEGGKDISFRVKTANTGNAAHLSMFGQDSTAVEDVMTSGTVEWRKNGTNYSYDIDEPEFQSGPETIVKLLDVREHDALSDLVELQEEDLWSAPSSSSDNRPYGIPFWIKKDATTTVGGAFNGGNPTGFSSGAAGISSTTYTRWKNWTFGYTNPSTDDLVAKMKKAMRYTDFQAPVPHPELGHGKDMAMIFTTFAVVEPLERLAETRNDNLGRDLAKFIDSTTVGGVPLRWVPYLTSNDSTDPVYGVNFKYFRPYCKNNAYMRRTKPLVRPGQHDTRTVFIDNWMQYVCLNRRAQWVGSTS